VIVNGKEGKPYDDIGTGSLTFSPDSRRVACVAIVGDKQFVVVDGNERKPYNIIVGAGGKGFIFDSAERLHYLAGKGNGFYLVTEDIE
jgi:hypothetical protein